MRRPSNAVFAIVGTGVWSAGNFMMNSAVTKRGAVDDVAAYIIAMAVASPICDFAFLSLRGLQNSDGSGEFSFGEYLALRLLGIVGSLAVLGLWTLGKLGTGVLPGMTFLFGLRICVDAAIDMHHGLMQKLGRLDLASISLGVRGIVGLAAFIAGLMAGGVIGALIGQLIASVLLLALYDRPMTVRTARDRAENATGEVLSDGLRPAFHWPRLRKLLTLALPLGITTVIISLNSRVGQYFTSSLPPLSVATFGMVASLVALERIFINALGVASSTGLGEAVAAGNRIWFSRLANRLMGLACLLTVFTGLLALSIGPQVVGMIFRPKYGSDPLLITLVMVAGGVACIASAQGYVLTALRVLRAQVPIYGISLIALIGANALLVPSMGIRGAAWAMLIGALVAVIGSQFYITRGMRRWI